MALLNFRDRNRLGRKHLVIILLLSFGLALSISFIATTPGAAQDECTDTGRVANGGLDWYFPGYPLVDGTFLSPMSGQSRFHIQECHHNQLAKGWGYISTETDGSWLLFSLSVEGGAMKVVH